MAYQIKSTPFFRRIVSTSKKNGQLQRLKEEYDRIKEFNEHNIEMKMRQVRLKRLFREIEEIKESSSSFSRRRRAGQDRLRTMDEIRLETFVKAKELGKEYSKLNALMVERSSSKVEATAVAAARLQRDKRYLSAKRINYGNEMSRSNMEKAQFAPKQRVPKHFIKSDQQIHDKKLESLQNRIKYGNSQSFLNMLKTPKRTKKVKSTKPLPVVPEHTIDVVPQTESIISDEPTLVPQLSKETKKYKTFEELQNSKVRIIKNPPSLSEKSNRLRTKHLWRKIRLLVLYRFDSVNPRVQLPLNQAEDFEEFKLRSISNDTYLPHHLRVDHSDKNSPMDVGSSSASTGNTDDADRVPEEADERLICSENFVKELTKKFERAQQENSQTKADECLKLRNVFSHLQPEQNTLPGSLPLPLPDESVQLRSQNQLPSQ